MIAPDSAGMCRVNIILARSFLPKCRCNPRAVFDSSTREPFVPAFHCLVYLGPSKRSAPLIGASTAAVPLFVHA